MSDKLFKFILKCCRNHNKPDLHSFQIDTKNGRAFVECRAQEVYIEVNTIDGRKSQWAGTPIAAANRLEIMGADFETVDM